MYMCSMNILLTLSTDVNLAPVHNFFKSNTEIHNKYRTYGHADGNAWNRPIWQLHQDIALGVNCSRGIHERADQFSQVKR